ncbi:MAG TPA: hypothetical protein VFC99_16415 [Acidimicrobiia bacterium]|nr:hypothetical protein [Acidimicrobiia bacterium]
MATIHERATDRAPDPGAQLEARATVLSARDAELYSLLFERLALLAQEDGDSRRAHDLARRALGLLGAVESQPFPEEWFVDVDLTELDLTDHGEPGR